VVDSNHAASEQTIDFQTWVPRTVCLRRCYEGILWIGIMAPAATPKSVIEKLAAAGQHAVRNPDLAERLKRDGIEPVGGTAESFAALIAKEIVQWRDLAQSAKITLD
jgi:tripartite-type tricarboxylate transporter receptor subunit TctC